MNRQIQVQKHKLGCLQCETEWGPTILSKTVKCRNITLLPLMLSAYIFSYNTMQTNTNTRLICCAQYHMVLRTFLSRSFYDFERVWFRVDRYKYKDSIVFMLSLFFFFFWQRVSFQICTRINKNKMRRVMILHLCLPCLYHIYERT